VEVTASLLAWPLILSRINLAWHPPSVSGVRDTLKRGWPLFLSASAVQLSASSSIVILGSVASRIEVGYFSAADKLIRASTAALNPLAQALYPHITAARLLSSSSAFHLIRKTLLAVGGLSILISLATAIWARPVCHMILGRQFEHSILVLQCLSPLPLLFGLAGVFGTQTMLVFEMDKLFSKVTLLSAAVAIPVSFVLSISFGAAGAAMASVIASGFLVILMLFALHLRGIRVWESPETQAAVFAETCCTSVE
jgi:O-antigen/teichoic acid export membrane protein